MPPTFDHVFSAATGKPAPFDYQRRLAGGNAGGACNSQLISIPTGLGKTAAIIVSF
jgi:CRISPR-associated endonuclease/helicase Cas3